MLLLGYFLLPQVTIDQFSNGNQASPRQAFDSIEVEVSYPDSIGVTFKPLLTSSKKVNVGDRLGYYIIGGIPAAAESIRNAALAKKLPDPGLKLEGAFATDYMELIGRAERALYGNSPSTSSQGASEQSLSREKRELLEADLFGAEDAATLIERQLNSLPEAETVRRKALIAALQIKKDAIASFKNQLSQKPASSSKQQASTRLSDELAEAFIAFSAKLLPDTTMLLAPASGKFIPSATRGLVGSILQIDTIQLFTQAADSSTGYLLETRGLPQLFATAKRNDSLTTQPFGAVRVKVN